MGALRETFAPLANRNLRIYLAGQAVSLIGTWMQNTAQSWVVWRLTGSEAALGLVGMLATLPMLLLGPLAGSMADRYDRRKILIYTQAGAMILALTLAALVLTQRVQLWHVYLLATILGCLGALDMPSQQAFIGDMAGRDLVRRAVVVNSMIVQISRVLGPTFAGLVVKLVGEGLTFLFNGLSFIAVIASLYAVRTYKDDVVRAVVGNDGAGDFREGVQFTLANPRILDLMIFTGLVTFFGFANATVLPAFASETLHGDAGLFGMLMGLSGAGALVSILLLVPWGQRRRRPGPMIAAAVAFAGIWYVLFSLTSTPVPAMAAYFATGLGMPLVLTTNNGLIQVLAPNRMRGRLLTLYLMTSFGLQPLANLWVGWVAEHLGAPMAIRVNGLALVIFAGLMLLRPGLTRWEPMRRAEPAES